MYERGLSSRIAWAIVLDGNKAYHLSNFPIRYQFLSIIYVNLQKSYLP